jgi:excisionase family DNA binding protein
MGKYNLPGEIMTVASLAQYLRCHRSTIYRLLKNRQIPAFKIGSDWRFARADIDRWMRESERAEF